MALGRIGKFLKSQELEEPYLIDETSKYAVNVDADFTWETTKAAAGKFAAGAAGGRGGEGGSGGKVGEPGEGGKANKQSKQGGKKGGKDESVLPTTALDDSLKQPAEKVEENEKPFVLSDLRMKMAKGEFIAIVGRVGSGKSSLLQALTGEMRKTRGDVRNFVRLSFPSQPDRIWLFVDPTGRFWWYCRLRPSIRLDYECHIARQHTLW